MYFFAERVGSIVKYIVQSVSRNEELAFEADDGSGKSWSTLLCGAIKKEILFEFGRRIKKKMNSALI